jgi:uncharacterized protein (TIGR02271 family)
MEKSSLGFLHRYLPAPAGQDVSQAYTLLLLYGTGGDEHDLLGHRDRILMRITVNTDFMEIQPPIIVGVFTQETQGQHALEALKQAGFGYDQVGIAMQGHGGDTLLNRLLNLGVSYERASYYAQEVKAGHIVVSVRADGREQEAHDILLSNGAHDSHHRTASPQTAIANEQQVASAQASAFIQAHLSDQPATNIQDDFLHPPSLKLREERLSVTKERVQTGEGDMRMDGVTDQEPVPAMHEEVVSEQRPLSGEHVDATPIGEEETIHLPTSEEWVNVMTHPIHAHTEKNRHVGKFPNGVLRGFGVGLLGIGLLVALMKREEIRRLVGESLQR